MRISDMGIVTELSMRGIKLWLMGENVRAFPKELLSDECRRIIAENRETIIEELREIESKLPKPYFNHCGDLVIPLNSSVRYRWWAGGQPVRETVREIRKNSGER